MAPDELLGDSAPQRIRILEDGHHHLVNEISDLVVAMREVRECLATGQARMTGLETELKINSTTTAEVRDILATARGAFRFFGILSALIKWFGIVATALTALYVLGYTITHGGRPPTH